MKTLSVQCECEQSVMGHFAQIEEQAANLKTLCQEFGMSFEDEGEDEGQVYDENGELDRSAADYADGLPDATCEEDEVTNE